MNSKPARLIVQIIGFAISLALLGWCISRAITPENREQLERLAEASWLQVGGLLVLSLLTLTINGLIFWVVLLPARRLRVVDMLATNAVATFLVYLPFKLSAIARVLIHNRRDKVPVLTIGAWFAAVAVLLLAALAPAALAAAVLGRIDIVWLLATVLGQCVIGAALVLVSRAFRGEAGQARLVAIASRLRIGILSKVLASRAWGNLHAGFDMLASPRVVAGAIALRMADIAVLSARFALAAAIFGMALPGDRALLIGLSHFLVGILSPFGVLGTREAGATGVAAWLTGGDGAETTGAFAAVVLLVGATEAIMYLACAALGLAWLRPDRLLRGRNGGAMPGLTEEAATITAPAEAHRGG